MNFERIYQELYEYCEAENFAGYDPFDGLNSRIFQATPLKYSAFSRLVWLQIIKRSPVNLRPFLKIEKGINPKAAALFASAELSRFRAAPNENHRKNSEDFLEKLLRLKIANRQSPIANRTAFGYNFDWQNRAFFAPRGTPTIVPTAFAAFALLEGFEIFETENYLRTVEDICRFIVEDLIRPFETETEICFSYTPDDQSEIYNASLLAAEVLAKTGKINGDRNYLELAEKAANYVMKRQKENGSWTYGAKSVYAWVDNFHTAYVLLSLYRLQKIIPALKIPAKNALAKGLNFWLENLFLDDGTPKYFAEKTFPIDIHSAAAAIAALCELNDFDCRCLPQAEKIAVWTIENMRDARGFFYYQKTASRTIKTSFMRWSNAWILYALAKLIGAKS